MAAPDFSHLAPETADRLTRSQQVALLLMHESQLLSQVSTRLPLSTFKVLRNKGLAKSRDEREWLLTEFGRQVQQVLMDRGASALG